VSGIYFHIPFCRRKCPYCDFVSGPFPEEVEEAYLKALQREMEMRVALPEVSSLRFETLYVGGGTPTAVPVAGLVSLLDAAYRLFPWNNGRPTEITVEANPESASEEVLYQLRAAGVDRLSLGVQSLSEQGLRVLGRNHTVSQAVRAFEAARAAQFPAVSIDLIYGWPGQSIEEWRRCLEEAVALGPDHLSCYELTLEGNTPLERAVARGDLTLPPEDTVVALTDVAEEFLAVNGYELYEISNFALPGRRCRHNLNYWDNGAYLGFGCSAVSYLPPRRQRNTDHVLHYLELIDSGRDPLETRETLDGEARFRESVVLALRLTEGLSLSRFSDRWLCDPRRYYGETLDVLIDRGLLQIAGDRLFLTGRGRRIANSVLCDLV
jgi:oxygen-independent coproporphyrinogen-3 oxidase